MSETHPALSLCKVTDIRWKRKLVSLASEVDIVIRRPRSDKNDVALILIGPWDSIAMGKKWKRFESSAYFASLRTDANIILLLLYYYYYYYYYDIIIIIIITTIIIIIIVIRINHLFSKWKLDNSRLSRLWMRPLPLRLFNVQHEIKT